MNMTCMTFNLRNHNADDGENAWEHRVSRIAELLKVNNPDIFGVQEAFYPMIEDLLSQIDGYEWIGEDRSGSGGSAYCAIFYRSSKFEVQAQGQFWLSETPDVAGSVSWDSSVSRFCTFGKLIERESGNSFFVYNTHLDHKGGEARLQGVKIILERMSPILEQGIPALLMGDFNCKPDSEPISFLRDNGFGENPKNCRLYDVYEKTNQAAPGTFNGFGKAKGLNPIDYIFVTSNISVLSVKVDKNNYGGGYPSDHYPVIADIVI